VKPGDREPVRPFRRKKKMGGAEHLQSFEHGFRDDPTTGHWCKACKLRHPWKKMLLSHVKDGAAWKQMWLCPETGNVIGEALLDTNREAEANDV
jgi:hypothetical protein